jgi:hypothetical protein
MGLMNIFKQKKPWIRFYSIDPGVAEITPIYPARKLYRPWRTDALKSMSDPARRCPYLRVQRLWKRTVDVLSGYDDHHGDSLQLANHAITCPALTGIMDSGYILPAPADFVIKPDGDGVNFRWISSGQFCDNTRYINSHNPEQTTGFRELVNQQEDVLEWTLKLETPWRVQAHPDVVFISPCAFIWELCELLKQFIRHQVSVINFHKNVPIIFIDTTYLSSFELLTSVMCDNHPGMNNTSFVLTSTTSHSPPSS